MRALARPLARPLRSLRPSPRPIRAVVHRTHAPPLRHAVPSVPVRPCRRYSTRHPSSPSDQPQSFADPTRPDLFYHLLPPPTPLSPTAPAFALSFLPSPPPSATSCTIIGWLPAEGAGEQAGLNDFVENPAFRDVLHEAIKEGLQEGVDDVQRNGAAALQEGWMHIHDARNPPALGRIGDPDDILASVRVEHGKVLASTYQPMPSYRLATADGLTTLTPALAAKLLAVLRARARSERA
ncbi:hypothetical protein GLOTRDRAFT_80907 [Gloeophyllum trabeum ATCC 11539]|uniref:Uncharacterized protein n=1 Tax=Gloeophyllum trabeum (strain ATCC 11539 / FP-39264 / Madison 617) TaxID=670483 RepID=S7PWZ1_GLOTA|nr:uncharacterized protein GLOTRDRAFT_80907 [Gloeophyllum trabeum ATCC 11539]EPQ51902.1 hypothetical protein GLOTRDRAFT_80907 [Gloeophyllum trabeum ATCC 11539]